MERLFVFSVGTIPSYVKGKLVRIGPGLFTFGKHEANYPMDGMGFLHSFDIADGEVEFQSRWEPRSERRRICSNILLIEWCGCFLPMYWKPLIANSFLLKLLNFEHLDNSLSN